MFLNMFQIFNTKQHGAAGARRAHNPEDARSKLAVAKIPFLAKLFFANLHFWCLRLAGIRREISENRNNSDCHSTLY